ncbi:hypothetical protein G6F56_004784 [Rhizopus delemar]|nr:hypothetical protein G6F56_004784 [Rhizopus delemar]
MDYDTESQNFHLKTLTRFRLYCDAQEKQQINGNIEIDSVMEEIEEKFKKQNKHYNQYSNEQKLLFVYYNRAKLFNAAKSARFAGGIAEHWNILDKQTNLANRPKPQLEGKHRVHLSFYDENPQARLVDAMNSLTGQFENLNIHKKTPSTMTAPHTILGAILAKFVVSMELRKPQENWTKRIKIDVNSRKRKAMGE